MMCVGVEWCGNTVNLSSAADSAFAVLIFVGALSLENFDLHRTQTTIHRQTILLTTLIYHISPKSLDTKPATPTFESSRHSLSIDDAWSCGWLNVVE
jgi:hypothetical protein